MNFSTIPFDDDTLQEECGVFGVSDLPTASAHVALGLHSLQHRGQEAAGIVSYDGTNFHMHYGPGKVGDNFNSEAVIAKLPGNNAIGHVRYSTAGGSFYRNVQPIFAEIQSGGIAIAHNGNLTNALTIKKALTERGCIFQSTMDTEVIIHLIAISNKTTLTDKIIDALQQIEGAYSLVILTEDSVIGVRDPLGIRPLSIGKTGSSYILSSETCGFDIIGAELVRDVLPGEIVIIKDQQITSLQPFANQPSPRFCIFEYIYFARPDSIVGGKNVYQIRKAIGNQLATERPVDADVIVPVPDSGVPSAIGYANTSNIPFELGIIRSHYVGRTFIEPADHVRHLGVKLKHNANRAVLKDKRVILIDDSIVRGTTSKKIVDMAREAGAKEVHMRIASPPTAYSCFYGIDTPDQTKLLAHKHDLTSMAKFIGVDSLAFISIDGLYTAITGKPRDNAQPAYCDACFTGDYMVPLIDKANKLLKCD